MVASYKSLWNLMIDKDKKELGVFVDISYYTVDKLNKNENVATDVLRK